jgi:hypothetical protein
MLRRIACLGLALGWCLLAQTDSAANSISAVQPKPLRVLFIGNSYTYFNNLPELLRAVAASQKDGPRIETEASLSGGKSLQWHWENSRALEAIRRGGWDFVVLQEHSLLGRLPGEGAQPAIGDPTSYFDFAKKFDAEIKAVGARTVLYATWAREGYPEQQRRLDDAFTQLARQVNAVIVPAGLAWTIAKIEAPELRLHMPDRSHPTMTGSYLHALLFYRCLSGRGAANPPVLIEGPAWNRTERSTLVQLPWSDVQTLYQFAQRAGEAEPLCNGGR